MLPISGMKCYLYPTSMEFFYDLDVIHFVTKDVSISLTKKLVYTQQPFIVDAYQINHCISQKPTLKSHLVDFKQGLRRAGFIPFLG